MAISTFDDLRGKRPDELEAIIADLDGKLTDLHQLPDGTLRHLSGQEQSQFDFYVKLRDKAVEQVEQHREIERVFREHPNAVERAYQGLDGGRAWSARRDDPGHAPLLGPGDSFVDYLADRGQKMHSEEFRVAVLGALGSGNNRALNSLARHLPEGETRDMLISSGGNAVLTPDYVSAELIDQLRKATVTVRLGARSVPMRSDTLKLPRLTGDPTVSWLAEGATVTATDATVDSVTLTARRLTGLTKVSQELVEDSDPIAVGDVLRTSFGGALAVEVDRVGLKGSGTPPEPQGIRNASGVSVNATAAAAAMSVVTERAGVLLAANVDPARIGVAVNTASFTTIMSATGSDGQFIRPPQFLENIQILPTTSLAGPATGELYAGDYTELIFGIRVALDFQVLRERFLDDGKIGFLPRIRMDVGVRHGASFAVRTALSS